MGTPGPWALRLATLLAAVCHGALAHPASAQAIKGINGTDVRRPLQPNISRVPTGGRVEPDGFPYTVEFSDESFDDAMKRSIAEHKVLIVVTHMCQGSPGRRNWWEHTLNAAWLKWHAIVIEPKGERHTVHSQPPDMDHQDDIGISMYIDGDPVPLNIPRMRPEDRGGPVTIGPATVLFHVDLAYEAYRTRDPLWGKQHDLANPPPPLPDLGSPLSGGDGDFPAVDDPAPVADGGTPDALSILFQARAAARAGKPREACAAYTWLWERAGAIDPALDPVRRMIVPFEMRPLRTASQTSEERLLTLRDRASRFLPWDEWPLTLDWAVLSVGLEEDGPMLTWFSEALDDPDWGVGQPIAKRRTLNGIVQLVDALKAGEAPALLTLARQLAAPTIPNNMPRADRPRYQQTCALLAFNAACKAYTLALTTGDTTTAAHAAAIARTTGGAAARRALVACALAADRVGPEHAALLNEAAAATGTDVNADPLMHHVRERLTPSAPR